MSRRDINLHGVEPKQILPLETNLTYVEDVAGHHANVNRAMEFGTIATGAEVGAADGTLLGKLILLERSGKASIQTFGVMLLPLEGAAPAAGAQVVCGASGTVKDAGVATNGRGRVLPAAAPAGFIWILLS